MLSQFRSKLHSVPDSSSPKRRKVTEDEDENEKPCELHSVIKCESCGLGGRDKDEDEDFVKGSSWMANTLVFKKEGADSAANYMKRNDNPEDLVVIDSIARSKEVVDWRKRKGEMVGRKDR
jgi:hypothetical protein